MRTALVTGASRGIGRGIAFDLAARGFGLTVSSRSESDLEALAADLLTAGSPSVVSQAADLVDRDALPAIVQLHDATFGAMDALVLSGGIATGGAFESIPASRVDKTLHVNVASAVTLIQASLSLLRRAGAASEHGARVVMLASLTGVYAEPGLAVYGATKAALLSLARTLTAEESGDGVLFTAVAPGYVDTDMAAWTHDTIPQDTMIPVADVVAVVRMVLSLHRNTSIPEIAIARSASDGHLA